MPSPYESLCGACPRSSASCIGDPHVDRAGGFPNLGNTCYINSVLQCFYHCEPFRHDLEQQSEGVSFMGDHLRSLWSTYQSPSTSEPELIVPLSGVVGQILRHSGFPGGVQQDAAECLMHILLAVDGGRMQQRVCGAYAVASVENMILCSAAAEAQVSREAHAVQMSDLLVASLTGDSALREHPPAVLVRVENTYEQHGQHFSVDARAAWNTSSLPLTLLDQPGVSMPYDVAGYVAHIHNGDADAMQRMKSGHYIALVCAQGVWYEINDAIVTRLHSPPSHFPYIVFLKRVAHKRRRGKHAITPDTLLQELLEARAALSSHTNQLQGSAECSTGAGTSSAGHGDRASQSTGRVQNRTGRIQDRDPTGRTQDRDQTGRTQDRDRTGRTQGREQTGLDERADRAWGVPSQGDNRDHSRTDFLNSLDHPLMRYKSSWHLRRQRPDEVCRVWHDRAEPSLPQPCRLCPDTGFVRREELLRHIDEEHGGLQRYRNAYFALSSLSPYVVKGQEWRAILANFSEFFARSALDWEKFTPEMEELLQAGSGLSSDRRWEPRSRQACVFCCRRLWREDLLLVYLAGPSCFMSSPSKVADLLDWSAYHQHWPDIPVADLKASAVNLRIGDSDVFKLVLLHKRRVSDAQARGEEEAFVCEECHSAFRPSHPSLCKYCLANHLWLGRWDPLFRKANLSHQMLLALARVVTTKVVLRPEGKSINRGETATNWDFLFHQSGMIGSAILFGNASCTKVGYTHSPCVRRAPRAEMICRPRRACLLSSRPGCCV